MAEGEEIGLYFFLELAAAFAVGFILVNAGVAYAKGTIYEKLNLAEDLGMQLNTIISLPGDAFIIISNFHGYSLNVVGNKIEVYSEAFDTTKGTYYFPKTSDLSLDVKLTKPKQVVVSKIHGQIRITEDIPALS